jgi:aryl-alcohol dehydrogenase-like predicted oxidoreductase
MILSAWRIADRYGLRKPTAEQAEYNLFARARVEREYRPLFDELGLGLSTWSPLASGLLSGKYLRGVPEHSRAGLPGYSWLHRPVLDEDLRRRVAALDGIARELNVTSAQLAIAWCTRNPDVSTVITGASSATQLRENLRSMAVANELSPAAIGWIETTFP